MEWQGCAKCCYSARSLQQTRLLCKYVCWGVVGKATAVSNTTTLQTAMDGLVKLVHSSKGNLETVFGRPGYTLVHWCHGAPGLAMVLCQVRGVEWGRVHTHICSLTT